MTIAEIHRYQKLPIEIIESEVLPRLPARSVGRFMCVCKRWRSLLSTQDFRSKNHHHITTGKPRTHQKLLILNAPVGTFCTLDCGTTPSDGSGTTSSIPFGTDHDHHDHEGMMILASLDGLVCVAIRKTLELMFWNPLTGAYWTLSKSHVHTFDGLYMDAFGLYSDSSNDYKILHLVREKEYADRSHVYIYSRRLDSWRQILTFNHERYLVWPKYQWSPGTLSGRNLYFTVVSAQNSCIIGFDVVSEKFREIHFPREVSASRGFNGTLAVMNGCIHLCVARGNIDRKFYMLLVDIDLWRMDRDGEGWTKVVRYSGNEDIPLTLTPNCKVRHGKWDVTWVFNKALVKRDTKTCKPVVTYRGDSFYDLVRAIYVETLMSPNP